MKTKQPRSPSRRILSEMLLHEGLNTVAGREATFAAPVQLAKRRNSSAKGKKTATTVSWPHVSPTPDQVRRTRHALFEQHIAKAQYSLREPASSISRLVPAPTTPNASSVRRRWMAGKRVTIQRSSTASTHRNVAGRSTCTSRRKLRKILHTKKKIRCLREWWRLGRPRSKINGPTKRRKAGNARRRSW